MIDGANPVAHRRAGFRIRQGESPRLARRENRASDLGLAKPDGQALLHALVDRLSALQERLYADRRWSVLVVLQAMDAGGKDGTIKHVFSGVNPQGIGVVSFKAPSAEELAHDFLWRIHRALPSRGMIGVFNRSHYEDVVVTRVRPELLDPQRLPEGLVSIPGLWDERLRDIAAFEDYLSRQGTRMVKIFLHVGRDEQKARLRARLDDPEKLWKFDPGDLRERARWDDYMEAYDRAIAATSTDQAPWYVVPADQKWVARLAVADIVVATIEELDLRRPEPDPDALDRLEEARRALE